MILEELTARPVELNLGGSVHDPTDPVGRLLFDVLAVVAEFESDLIRLRTWEDIKVAKAKGRLRGKQPKLNVHQVAHIVGLHRTGEHTTAVLADLFSVARSTVYRAIERGDSHASAGANDQAILSPSRFAVGRWLCGRCPPRTLAYGVLAGDTVDLLMAHLDAGERADRHAARPPLLIPAPPR